MKIYTKTGDDGMTSLLGGKRVSKADLQIEAYGTVDELNSALGMVRAHNHHKEIEEILKKIQKDLFSLGAELSQSEEYKPTKAYFSPLSEEDIESQEKWIDLMDGELPPLKNFILPGGSPASAALHLSRCICRRAERRVLSFSEQKKLRPEVLKYLNRLSDLLFVLARMANHKDGIEDLKWE